MKGSDLRIGNLILYKSTTVPVTMIGEFGIQSKTEDYLINAKFHTPDLQFIPLNERLLGKLSISKKNILGEDLFNIKKTNYYIKIDEEDEFELYKYDGYVDLIFITNIYFVSQLQNLIFYLTGIELTY